MTKIRRVQTISRNVKKSADPTYVPGRTSRSYSFRETGLELDVEVRPGEDRAAFEQLLAGYYELFAPVTLDIRLFVDELVHNEWMLRRLRTDSNRLPPVLRQQWMDASRRSYESALKYIHKIRSRNNRYHGTSPEIGFVPAIPSEESVKILAPRKETVH
jgi:hypothetical protein